MENVLEDITFNEFVAPVTFLGHNRIGESSLSDLEKQLSKFDTRNKEQEAQTYSFLAKVNARITNNIQFSGRNNESAANMPFDNSISQCDNLFILQKNPAHVSGQQREYNGNFFIYFFYISTA